jgi:hypothetical protein
MPGAQFCVQCGTHVFGPRTQRIEDDPAMRMLLPVGRSGLAIAAGYMALFCVLLVPGPLALLLGILALRDIRDHPEKLGKGRAWFGIIMGAAATAIMIVIGIGAGFAKG